MNKKNPTAPGTLYMVAAPSGAGKTSLLDALLRQRDDAVLSISATTRAPRPGEDDGKHYRFVTSEAFDQMVKDGDFLEHARVFGYQYGTPRAPVEEQLTAGVDVILEIDWQGARQIRAHKSDAVGIFILPPSRDALLERLKNRRQDAPEIIEARMAQAEQELSHYKEFDYLLVNDDFDRALSELDVIVAAGRLEQSAQSRRYRELLSELCGA